MELLNKIRTAFDLNLKVEYSRLEENDGISGFVVSRQFENMSTLDRQALIDDALSHGSDPLSKEEQRQILLIAGVTPEEYESVGAPIRVLSVTQLDEGSIEVQVDGGYSDAEFVRGALASQKGVSTTEPESCSNGSGKMMKFRAMGTDLNPLLKEKALEILALDQYIKVLQNV